MQDFSDPDLYHIQLRQFYYHYCFVQLANPDTPIDEWNIPGIPETFRVSIKRDDMTGSTLSGNKVSGRQMYSVDKKLNS